MINLPATCYIQDRIFSVTIKHCPKEAGGGGAEWCGHYIEVYIDETTSDIDILDTFLHECLEMWMAGNNVRAIDTRDDYRFIFDHAVFERLCAFISILVFEVWKLNPELSESLSQCFLQSRVDSACATVVSALESPSST
jgi:hypothetical protein